MKCAPGRSLPWRQAHARQQLCPEVAFPWLILVIRLQHHLKKMRAIKPPSGTTTLYERASKEVFSASNGKP